MVSRLRYVLRKRQPHVMRCLSCGRQISLRWRFCAMCGEKIDLHACRQAAEETARAASASLPRSRKRRSARSRYSLISKAGAWIAGRASQLIRVGVGAAAVVLACLAWALLVEPNRVQETRITIPVRNLPAGLNGFRIVQISDIHIREFGGRERRAVEIANRAKPDVVALTGDYAGGAWGSRTDRSLWEIVRMVRLLRPRQGIYAVWGDWDYSPVLRQRMEQAGVNPLLNQGRTLYVNGSLISIVGLGLNITDLPAALKQIDPDSVKVLLCHEAREESVDEAAEAGIDVTLIGGEHGGQICLPFIGPLRPAPPENYGRRYMSGLHSIHDRMSLYANRGLGTSNLPMRFLCPPEVTVITLSRAR